MNFISVIFRLIVEKLKLSKRTIANIEAQVTLSIKKKIARFEKTVDREIRSLEEQHLNFGDWKGGIYLRETSKLLIEYYAEILKFIKNKYIKIVFNNIFNSEDHANRIIKFVKPYEINWKKKYLPYLKKAQTAPQNEEGENKRYIHQIENITAGFFKDLKKEYLINMDKSKHETPPKINYFKISPERIKQGDMAVISWDVENALPPVIIENHHEKGGSGVYNFGSEFMGSIYVKPSDSVRYHLVAENSKGKVKEKVLLTVSNKKKQGKIISAKGSTRKHIETSDQAIMVFDIRSSTKFVENLHSTGQLNRYYEMIQNIYHFLEDTMIEHYFKIYKFLGDGFIIVFNHKVKIEDILKFSPQIINTCKNELQKISSYFDQPIDIHKGITIGLDKNIIHNFKLNEKEEYIGPSINLACRLQRSELHKDEVNSLLMSHRCFCEIRDEKLRSHCLSQEGKFKNIKEEEPISCYLFSPEDLNIRQ